MNKQILSLLAGLLISLTGLGQGRLTPELLWMLGRVNDVQISPNKMYVLFGITYYDVVENSSNTDYYVIRTDGDSLKRITDSPEKEFNARWRPDGKRIGFLRPADGIVQLWEVDPTGENEKRVTSFKESISGFLYSPKMDNILYIKEVKLDPTPQEKYPDLPKADVRIIDDLMYRHWNSWHDYSYNHIFIAPYSSGKVNRGKDIMKDERWDAPIEPDGGMEQIAWSPDGTKIAYACKKLKGKEYALSTNSEIYIYDLKTGKTENLTESGFDGYDLDPAFSPDGTKIAWRSMATAGYESDRTRLMMYDFASKLAEELTNNFDNPVEAFQWDSYGKAIYFIGGINATYQLFSVELSKKKTLTQITKGPHDYQALQVGTNFLIGQKMSMSMPSEIFRVDLKNNKETQLTFTNKHFLDSIKLGNVEERWIETTDGKKMLTWVIYPPDFNPSKKYPALLYCQGGPQSAVSQFWSYRWNFQMMAANGYIVVAPNRRGLPTFGSAWNDQITEDYGGQNMKDYLSAIDALCKEPYVNKDKLGAVGASYGGFSVFWLAGNHNKRFKAFISHCGMFNLESQYASTEEYWFVNHDLGGAPWDNPKPKSYDFSPHRYVDKWDTPILIITGGNDFRIPYTESLQAFNAAQLKGIPSRLLYYPNESHFVLKPQNSILWQREFFRFLNQYLK